MKNKSKKTSFWYNLCLTSSAFLFTFTSCGDAGKDNPESGNSGSISKNKNHGEGNNAGNGNTAGDDGDATDDGKNENTLALSSAGTFDDAATNTVKYVIDRSKTGLSYGEAISITRQDDKKVCGGFIGGSYINLTELLTSAVGELGYYDVALENGEEKLALIRGTPSPTGYGVSTPSALRVVKITAAGDESTREKSFYFVINFEDCS